LIQIDFDKPRNLHFDLAAVRDLEGALGGQPLGVIVQQMGQIGVNAIVLGLWAGLKHEDKSLNPTLVTRKLETYIKQGKSLKKLGVALNDALEEVGLFRNEDAEGNEQPELTT
jgi:hypothetical protein